MMFMRKNQLIVNWKILDFILNPVQATVSISGPRTHRIMSGAGARSCPRAQICENRSLGIEVQIG
jgi:hypothetical protein